MAKNNRIDAILSLIEENEIDTQEELTEKLIEKGFNVSQATVSRDIGNLGLIKINGIKKKFKYSKPLTKINAVSEQILSLFKNICVSITRVDNLIVVKTLSGNAGSAGMAVDEMKINGILGTIAGDDTLLIITKSQKEAENIHKSLQSL